MKIFMITLCFLATESRASSTDLLVDANTIMQLLQTTINFMEPLSQCFSKASQAEITIEEKRRCLAILLKLPKARTNRSTTRGQQHTIIPSLVRPGHPRVLRGACRSFHRWGC